MIRLHSRWGSIALGLLGAAYTIAASILLASTIGATWHHARLFDYALYAALLASIAISVWFVFLAAASLGFGAPTHLPHFRRTRAGDPTGAAVR